MRFEFRRASTVTPSTVDARRSVRHRALLYGVHVRHRVVIVAGVKECTCQGNRSMYVSEHTRSQSQSVYATEHYSVRYIYNLTKFKTSQLSAINGIILGLFGSINAIAFINLVLLKKILFKNGHLR